MFKVSETRKISKLTCEKLELIAGGHTAFQLLWGAVDLGLFNLLSRRPGLTEPEIQKELRLEKKAIRILLVGTLSLSLIERRSPGYWNSKLVEEHLVDGKTGSMAPVFELQARVIYPGIADFVSSLRENRNVGLRHFPGTGATLYERLTNHPDLEKVFQKALSALSKKTNAAMLEAYDFGKLNHILDVGGGDGTNATSLVQRFPHLRTTVFDFPSVGDMAEAKIHGLGLEDRVHVHRGNFLQDPFPTGMDGIMFNHIAPIWSGERNRELFKKSYDALPRGGAVFVFNMMTADDDRGPLTPAFGSVYFLTLATGEGMLYRWKDYTGWLKEAGFHKIERIDDLPLHHGLLAGWKE